MVAFARICLYPVCLFRKLANAYLDPIAMPIETKQAAM
jgi:hypothetical protein